MFVKSLSRYLAVVLIIFSSFTFFMLHTHASDRDDGIAVLLNVKGAIGPAISDYIQRGIKEAEEEAKLVVMQLDTPGGLATSMRDIIQAILNAEVPVVTYIAPSGARAASAGTYILYASHVAAMAPGTNLGAATPVAVGFTGPAESKKDEKGEVKKSPLSSMELKATNDAIAYIRSLAELRDRNADWAELAVKEASSLSAQEALKKNVIDVIAESIPDLMKKIDGVETRVGGETQKIASKNTLIKTFAPDWRTRFLSVITDPSIAYILMLVGIYGLFLEFTNPGIILPGVAGAICILLSLYAFQLLPINYVGLALMMLGIAFMVSEAFVASYGILGAGGVIAFIVGSVLLMDTNVPGYTIAMPLIVSVGIITGFFVVLVMNMALRARRRPVVSGREEVIGSEGTVISLSGGIYRVRVHGEVWQAKSASELEVGQQVRIIGMDGLLLEIE